MSGSNTAGTMPPRFMLATLSAAVTLAVHGLALAQSAPAASPSIYSCEVNGKRITADRPIPECNSVTQSIKNRDGSNKGVRPPVMTADEQSDYETHQREAALAAAVKQEAYRRDKNLLNRFPDEAAHRKGRIEAMASVRRGVAQSEARLAALAIERKPLNDEAEFYVGKPLPFKLKLALDANDASVEAQRSLLANQQLEVIRLDALYDAELERLRKLWRGAQPGSLGVIAGAASSPNSATVRQ